MRPRGDAKLLAAASCRPQKATASRRAAAAMLRVAGLGARLQTVRVPAWSSIAEADVEVALWFVEAVRDGACLASLAELLGPDERARSGRFRLHGDRALFVTAHAATRLILGAHLDAEPRELTFRRSAHGKPRLAGPHAKARAEFNLSHAGSLACVAVTGGWAVGVDVERIDTRRAIGDLAGAILNPSERERVGRLPPSARTRRLFQVWVRKEAVLKATGRGLSVPVRQVEVGAEARLEGRIVCVASASGESWRVCLSDVACPEGYVAAVALAGASIEGHHDPAGGEAGPSRGRGRSAGD